MKLALFRPDEDLIDENTYLSGPAASRVSQWSRICPTLDRFKSLVAQVDEEVIVNGGISTESIEKIRASFRALCTTVNEEIGDSASVEQAIRDAFGARIRRELLPYLLLTHTAEKWYSKPRGYAGDFLTISEIYRNQPAGNGRVGALIDRCWLDIPAAIAVRNRRQLMVDQILHMISRQNVDQPVHVTSLACGPAVEIFDVFKQLPDPGLLKVTLIDIDYGALEHLNDQVRHHNLRKQVEIHHGNLLHIAAGRRCLEIPPQDLVYSIGLIDYLIDRRVVALTDWIYTQLRPGGRVILGNFHPSNPTKALMDHVLDWKLIHRSEAEMDSLYMQSAFHRTCSNILREDQGINLFAECIK